MSANIDSGVILGALGSAYTNTTDPITPPTGMVIAAIQFIDGGTSATTRISALVAENADKTFNTVGAANGADTATTDKGTGGKKMADGVTHFPAGMTIYGRWTSVTFTGVTNGGAICYFGY